MTTTREPHGKRSAGRRDALALACLCLRVLVASMDVSVLFFAVPFIARDLTPTATEQLWIFDVYGFVLAGLLFPMGALGDRIGRRLLLLVGIALFAAASVLAAFASSAAMLIAARALLGLGGATLMPSTLGLIRTIFPDGAARAKAIAVWSSVMAAGVGVGPVLSGLLLERFWWGSVFLVNLPVMALLLVAGPVLLPEAKARRAGRLDALSALLSLLAVVLVVYCVTSLASDGWSAPLLGYAVAAVTCAAAFLVRQRRSPEPFVDPALFGQRAFTGALGVNCWPCSGSRATRSCSPSTCSRSWA
ncbi:MAG: MFS transporter [Dermatophilaceae bacterium]